MKAENKTLETLVADLIGVGRESEWVEFKVNNTQPSEIGEYLSALSNGVCLSMQPYGWMVFGVNDKTLKATSLGLMRSIFLFGRNMVV